MPRQTTCQIGATLTAALLVLASAGCSEERPGRTPVTGRVLIDGNPLTVGTIRFIPEDARQSSATIGADGRFTLTCFEPGDGAVLGRHRVVVAAVEHLSEEAIKWHAPKKYADTQTSGLEVEIAGATEDLTIELTWDGGAPFTEGG